MLAVPVMLVVLNAAVSAAAAGGEAPATQPIRPYQAAAPATRPTEIDRLVAAKLTDAGLRPALPCSDSVFVRRVYLDVIGTLPTPAEARQFFLDTRPDKRRQLIEQLLSRDEYADYWAMKWCEVLRVKAEFPVKLWPNAAQAYHRWVRTAIAANMPYDRFARALLTSSGSNFREPAVNFYRAAQNRDPDGLARTVALTFMGERAEKWPADRLSGTSVFFGRVGYKLTGEWKEEIVFDDLQRTTTRPSPTAVFPDGKSTQLGDRDPRELFADWLIRADNSAFARAAVNREWAWLIGRGIVEEVDDFRPDNPPSNPELLAYLEKQFIASHYDLKQLQRLILNSQTYQQSSIPATNDPRNAALFAAYPVRQLDAEVLIDAIDQITGTTERYSSPIPEPYTFLPENTRSIALPDASVTSSFLETFGRPSRDTGLAAERNNRATAGQRLMLLNSSMIQRKLDQARLFQAPLQVRANARDIVNSIYLAILSRYPTEDEFRAVDTYIRTGPARGREVALDLAWSLINSPEFLYRH